MKQYKTLSARDTEALDAKMNEAVKDRYVLDQITTGSTVQGIVLYAVMVREVKGNLFPYPDGEGIIVGKER